MWTAIGILSLCLIVYRWLSSSSAHRYPPGPKPLPVIGNVHQVPMEYQHRKFAQWSKEYGDLVYAKMFRTPTLIINSLQVAQDLMEKKSAKYSDRPRTVMLKELLGWDPELVLLNYGEQWRRHRKWVQSAFHDKTTLLSYYPIQRRETYILIANLMETPEQYKALFKRFAAALIMETTYGYPVTTTDDIFVRTADEAMKTSIEAGGAASTLVDFFPIMKYMPAWMPGAGFKRDAIAVRPLVMDSFTKPYDFVRDQMAKGIARPSLVGSLIEDATRRGVLEKEELDIMGAAAGIYTAGMDTTGTALLSFLLAMAIYPEVFVRAQEEVDRVIGHGRLPDYTDREAGSLPYIEAIVKEVYRWNPPAPLGIAHSLMEEDEYNGYYMPKGSLILPNIWFMGNNPDVYPVPERFDPERFLETSGKPAEADPRAYVFGFGRRACPGRNFADASLWLFIALAAAMLNIGRAKDENGKEIVPDMAFISGIVSHPLPFKVAITPRSERAVDMIAQARASVAA